MNPEIYRQLADRPDFNAECRAARKIFKVLGLNGAARKHITSYCLYHNIIDNPIGREPQVAVFTIKSVLRRLHPSAAVRRVHDFVLADTDIDWYPTGVYPLWTGAVTAQVRSSGIIIYAVHADDMSSLQPEFWVKDYYPSGQRVFIVQQGLQDFVGEFNPDELEGLFPLDDRL
jgi:hypothetical protein